MLFFLIIFYRKYFIVVKILPNKKVGKISPKQFTSLVKNYQKKIKYLVNNHQIFILLLQKILLKNFEIW